MTFPGLTSGCGGVGSASAHERVQLTSSLRYTWPSQNARCQAVTCADPVLGEAWERAAYKLGILVPPKPMSAAAFSRELSVTETDSVKAYSSSSAAVDTRDSSNSFTRVGSRQSKSEVFKPVVVTARQFQSDPLKSAEHEPERQVEPSSSSKQIVENDKSKRLADQVEGVKVKKTPAKRRSTVKKASADGSPVESKPKPRGRKKSAYVQLEGQDSEEVNVSSDRLVLALNSEEPFKTDQLEKRQTFSNEFVMVIDSVDKAKMVVKQLMREYKDAVHACDTEVCLYFIRLDCSLFEIVFCMRCLCRGSFVLCIHACAIDCLCAIDRNPVHVVFNSLFGCCTSTCR